MQPSSVPGLIDNGKGLEAIKKLAHAIVSSAAFQEFDHASKHLHDDPIAKQLLSEFMEEQRMYLMQQSWGGESIEDKNRLDGKRNQVLTNGTLQKYFETQETLVLMLKEVNSYVSEGIGIDFAQMAKPAGGCC